MGPLLCLLALVAIVAIAVAGHLLNNNETEGG